MIPKASQTNPGPLARLGPCATLSMLAYDRTSRSLLLVVHFPFWAVLVCSLSGAQPEIWSVGWKPPVHRIPFGCSLLPLNPTFRRSSQAAEGEPELAPGPGLRVLCQWPGPLGYRAPGRYTDASRGLWIPLGIKVRPDVAAENGPLDAVPFPFFFQARAQAP